MPVELPTRSTRTRPIVISITAIALSAVATLSLLPKDAPPVRPEVVGVAAARSGEPTSSASRVPDALALPAKKKAKQKPKASSRSSSGGGSAASTASAASSAPAASSGGSAAPRVQNPAPVQRPSGSGGSSGGGSSGGSSGGSAASAAEAEFGPG